MRPLLHPRDEIVQTMERIYRYRMTTTSGGNLSIRGENVVARWPGDIQGSICGQWGPGAIQDCFAHRTSAPPDSGFERFEFCGCFDRVQEYSGDETRGRIRWPQ
jgi:hypothetical protein